MTPAADFRCADESCTWRLVAVSKRSISGAIGNGTIGGHLCDPPSPWRRIDGLPPAGRVARLPREQGNAARGHAGEVEAVRCREWKP
jgi:hypothetical protein